MGGAALSPIDVLAARAAAVPEAIARLVTRGLPSLGLPLAGRRWSVTAAGVAEGPARFLVQLLGPRARFVPLSSLAIARSDDDVRVVFSQGLSPNARIALADDGAARDRLLFTSARGAPVDALTSRGVRAVPLDPVAPEDGMLLRVLGPAVARAAALCLAREVLVAEGALAPSLDGVADAVHAAAIRGEALAAEVEGARLHDPLAIVGQGADLEWARALAWKWMEGLWTVEPPVWDVLQVTHGPLQSLYGRRAVIFALSHEPAAPLFTRLRQVLEPTRHLVLEDRATLPGPLAVLEHDVVMNALLLRALRAAPRELSAWPGRDADAALYGLDRPLGRGD